MKQQPYNYDPYDYQRLDEFVLLAQDLAQSVHDTMRANAAELHGEDRKAHKVDEIDSAAGGIMRELEQFSMARNATQTNFIEYAQPKRREMTAMGTHYDRVKENFSVLKRHALGLYVDAEQFAPAELALAEAGARLAKMGVPLSRGPSRP